MITLDEFLKLGTGEIAARVRGCGPQVCVFPINGTRRWFLLEHAHALSGDPIQAYLDLTARAHLRVYRLLFDHGIDTIIAPAFGRELFQRGDAYVRQIGAEGLSRLAAHPDFLAFYAERKVRVHFYGDHRRQLQDTPFAALIDQFAACTRLTAGGGPARLFYGVFANDGSENIAELAVAYHARTGRLPDREALAAAYYGEPVTPATLFIGFDKFSVFDYPLLNLGEEDLYFTIAPSLYMDEMQLRRILYDHLVLRRAPEPDYEALPPGALARLRDYYQRNRQRVLGVGRLQDGLWQPEDMEDKTA